jgi:hypothetical protein
MPVYIHGFEVRRFGDALVIRYAINNLSGYACFGTLEALVAWVQDNSGVLEYPDSDNV